MVSRLGRVGLPDDGVDKPCNSAFAAKHLQICKLGKGFVRGAGCAVNFGWLPVMERPASAHHEIGTPIVLAACKTLASPSHKPSERRRGHTRAPTRLPPRQHAAKKTCWQQWSKIERPGLRHQPNKQRPRQAGEANRSLEKRNNPEDAD